MLKPCAVFILLMANDFVFGLQHVEKITEGQNDSAKEMTRRPREEPVVQMNEKGADKLKGNVEGNGDSEKEIFDKGLSLIKKKQWQEAYEVFIFAWKVFNESEISGHVHDVGEIKLIEKVMSTAYRAGRISDARNACLRILNHIPLTADQRGRFARSLRMYENKLSTHNLQQMYQGIENATVEEQMQIAKYVSSIMQYDLCNDEVSIPAMKRLSENSKLFCRYDNRKRHPLLILSPLKEEVLGLSPIVITLYDLTTDSETEALKTHVANKDEPATVKIKNKDLVIGYSRKLRTARSLDHSMANLLARLEAAFGVSPTQDACSRFQILHYTIGGHFMPHIDSRLSFANMSEGDGIATALLYLNDVEDGGATIFTTLGIRIPAKKGSGVFWFNDHKNETANWETIHGSCPVLKGEKWVATRWYMWRGQLLHRKHGMTENEDFTLEDLNLPPEIRFRKYRPYSVSEPR